MIRLLPLLLLVLSLAACSSDEAVETEEQTVAVEATNTQEEATTEDKYASELVNVVSFEAYEQMVAALGSDKTYVINFWATWCKPCVEELPHFEKLHNEYATDNIEVIMVSLDFARTLKTKVEPFLRKHTLSPKQYLLNDLNYDSWIDKVSPEWSGAIPATLVINKTTNRYDFYESSFDYETLVKTIITKS